MFTRVLFAVKALALLLQPGLEADHYPLNEFHGKLTPLIAGAEA